MCKEKKLFISVRGSVRGEKKTPQIHVACSLACSLTKTKTKTTLAHGMDRNEIDRSLLLEQQVGPPIGAEEKEEEEDRVQQLGARIDYSEASPAPGSLDSGPHVLRLLKLALALCMNDCVEAGSRLNPQLLRIDPRLRPEEMAEAVEFKFLRNGRAMNDGDFTAALFLGYLPFACSTTTT